MRGFREILDGEHDDLSEGAFYMKGTIDQVVEEARGSRNGARGAEAEEKEAQSAEQESSEGEQA